jgi:hypothetical protein
MSGTWKWYGKGLLAVASGSVNLSADTFKLMLTTSSYTPNQDLNQFRSDVTNEVNPSGTYVVGGQTIAGRSVTFDPTTNEVRMVWNDVVFTNASIRARTAVLYKVRGGLASADELIAFCTEAADVESVAGTFTVDIPAISALKITVAA